jgi:hypothetical protein
MNLKKRNLINIKLENKNFIQIKIAFCLKVFILIGKFWLPSNNRVRLDNAGPVSSVGRA